jgi:hypothetical protein
MRVNKKRARDQQGAHRTRLQLALSPGFPKDDASVHETILDSDGSAPIDAVSH